MSLQGDHRETADGYRRVVHRLGGWRIIRCKDDIQWIIQRNAHAGCPRGAGWRAVAYVRGRAKLIQLWVASTGEDSAILAAMLPELVTKTLQ